MKILLENLAAKVTETLLAIRAGVEAACTAGLVAELPKKVDFTIEVITGYQALEEVQNATDAKTGSGTQVKGAGASTTTQIKSPAVTVTTQAQPQSVSESVQSQPAETITTSRSGGGNVSTETQNSQQAENQNDVSDSEEQRKLSY